MNQNEKLELYEVKRIIKRHTIWGGTKWSYGNISPDNLEKIAEIINKLLDTPDET